MLTVFRSAHRTRRTVLFASAAAAAAALAFWASGGFQSAAAQTAGASFSARLVINPGSPEPVSFPVENYGFAAIADELGNPGFVFRFQKPTSTQSRDLWLGLMERRRFDTTTLNVLKSGTLYLRVVMQDVLVKRLVTVGAGAEQPRDALVVLTAAKVSARYPTSTETTPSEVERGYDQPDWDVGIATNK